MEEMDKLLLNMYYSPGIMLDLFFFFFPSNCGKIHMT